MLSFDKWKFPDNETHLQEWMRRVNNRVDGRLTYQYGKYEKAMEFVENRRVCIDVGSHVGLWAWYMARDFENVACFEPKQEHQECWEINMQDRANAELYKFALGAEKMKVGLYTNETSSGDTFVVMGNDVEMYTLDSINLTDVDLIKIDCEGYELDVLKGAVDTILKHKPVIIVEQKGNMIEKYGHKKLGAVKFLENLGYKTVHITSGDYILKWVSETK